MVEHPQYVRKPGIAIQIQNLKYDIWNSKHVNLGWQIQAFEDMGSREVPWYVHTLVCSYRRLFLMPLSASQSC